MSELPLLAVINFVNAARRPAVPVAAFDVDKTLTVRDCVVPFMSEIVGRGVLARAISRNAVSIGRGISRRDRDSVKELMVRQVFANQSVQEVEEKGVAFAEKVVASWIRPDVAERLRFHQEEGHSVILVSASLDPYLVPLGTLLGVDAVLCTQLQQESDGSYSGELVGRNCRGLSKVHALEEWGGALDGADSWLTYAYGDSPGDRYMLQRAVHGVDVSRTTLRRSC